MHAIAQPLLCRDPAALQASGSLLFLSCIAMILPTAAERLLGSDGRLPFEDVLLISRITALGLLAMWVIAAAAAR
jgi:hypothetical protein